MTLILLILKLMVRSNKQICGSIDGLACYKLVCEAIYFLSSTRPHYHYHLRLDLGARLTANHFFFPKTQQEIQVYLVARSLLACMHACAQLSTAGAFSKFSFLFRRASIPGIGSEKCSSYNLKTENVCDGRLFHCWMFCQQSGISQFFYNTMNFFLFSARSSHHQRKTTCLGIQFLARVLFQFTSQNEFFPCSVTTHAYLWMNSLTMSRSVRWGTFFKPLAC